MNEQIRRLMEQAVISIDGQTFGKTYVPDAFTEKFAELIVFECVKIAVFKGDATTGKAIKEHFGAEQ